MKPQARRGRGLWQPSSTSASSLLSPLSSILPLLCRAVRSMSSGAQMGNASRPLTNAMEAKTAKMGAMRPQRHVARTALKDTSNAQMGNASGPLGNAMETRNALMGAMKPKRHVEPTARRSKGDLPAQMGNASRPITNAMESSIALMGAMRPMRHVETTVGE